MMRLCILYIDHPLFNLQAKKRWWDPDINALWDTKNDEMVFSLLCDVNAEGYMEHWSIVWYTYVYVHDMMVNGYGGSDDDDVSVIMIMCQWWWGDNVDDDYDNFQNFMWFHVIGNDDDDLLTLTYFHWNWDY